MAEFDPDPEVQSPPIPEAPPEKPNLEGLLTTIIGQLNELKADNQAIKRDQIALREQIEQTNLVGPGVMHTSDPNTPMVGDERFARRATLVTRPVQDNPQDYSHLISTADLRLPG